MSEERTAPAPRPPHPRTQTEPVLLRLEPEHLETITKAAKLSGLARAAWMRSTLLREARVLLKEAS